MKIISVTLILTLGFIQAIGQNPSVLSSGTWYKLSVPSEGVYQINADFLNKIGISPGQIDPRNIKIFTGHSGMLPAANSDPRITDLVEIPIQVSGEADGRFDNQDYILFAGQGPDTYQFLSSIHFFSYSHHLYSDLNYYFLTVGTDAGKRIDTQISLSGTYPVITQFDYFGYYENDQYNLLQSGRQWFGEQFDNITEATIQFNIPGIIQNSDIHFSSHVMAHSANDCSFDISFNNNPILTQSIAATANTQYSIKGNITIDTIVLNSSMVNAPVQPAQQIKYSFKKGVSDFSVGYLDFVIFSLKRNLALYSDPTIYTSEESLNNPVSTFQLQMTDVNSFVWDITDMFHPHIQSSMLNGTTTSYSINTSSLKKFITFNLLQIKAPSFEKKIINQNLHTMSVPDLLIISAPDFITQASRLAVHRQMHNQLSVAIIIPEQIYNEYSGGKQDVTAIRDFIRDLYKRSGNLKNVLLFGRGSYDYKNRVYNNTNFVPIYESLNSLNPLSTYASNDYFAFLEDNEGQWDEDPPKNFSMDIGIGRLPVKSLQEAQYVVDKLIDYDVNPVGLGPWRKNIIMVADDGETNLFMQQADTFAQSLESTDPEFNTKRLFLDNFKKVQRPSGVFSPDASRALDMEIRKGVGILNYIGHGSEQVWMQEQILSEDMVINWKNGPRYPLFVTATCEFGRNDDPLIIADGERALLQPKGGAIGLVTTSRPVYASNNYYLNNAFYQALVIKINGTFRDLGTIFKDTKNNSLSGIGNRNFTLLGDPSMSLALSNNQVVATQVTTSLGSDTLNANSSVVIQGQIQNNGNRISSFNGEVFATLYDQPQNFATQGYENPPFVYSERTNILFQGAATVSQGQFQFNFILPKDMAASYNVGKLSLYASNGSTDAIGASTAFMVGGVASVIPTDTQPPVIRLFLNDTTFVEGGVVGPNSKLVAILSDESGINTTSINPANALVATLDNKQSFLIADYYQSMKDNSSRGMVTYPLDTLSKGKHQLTLTATDNLDNKGTSSINFVVSEGEGIKVNDFICYPNPFNPYSQNVHFQFTHTEPGNDLDASLSIYDLTGQLLWSKETVVNGSPYLVVLPEWNGETDWGTKLASGLYLGKLVVRSLSDGSKNEQISKLIILN